MSIDIPVPAPIVIASVKDRTWRVECFTDYGTDYKFVAHRERVYLDDKGELVKKEALPDVVRAVSQVKTDVNAIAMLSAVKSMADVWAEEDASA